MRRECKILRHDRYVVLFVDQEETRFQSYIPMEELVQALEQDAAYELIERGYRILEGRALEWNVAKGW